MEGKFSLLLFTVISSIVNITNFTIAVLNKDQSSGWSSYFIWLISFRGFSSLCLGIIVSLTYNIKRGVIVSLFNLLSLDFFPMRITSSKKAMRLCNVILFLHQIPLLILQLYHYQIRGLLLDQSIDSNTQCLMIILQLVIVLIFTQLCFMLEDGYDSFKVKANLSSIFKKLYKFCNIIAYYGLWLICCTYFCQQDKGYQVILIQIVLTIVEIIISDVQYKYLKHLKVSWGSSNIFRYIYNLLFLRKNVYSGRDILKMIFYNTKVCIFRSIIVFFICIYDSNSEENFIFQQSNESSDQKNKVVLILRGFLILISLYIIYHILQTVKISQQLNLFCGKDVLKQQKELEQAINQISKKKYTYIINVFLNDFSGVSTPEGYTFLKEDAQYLLKKVLNQSFKAAQDRQKSIIVDNIIQFVHSKQCIKLIKPLEMDLLMSLNHLDIQFVKHGYSFNECKNILDQRFAKYGIFSKQTIEIVNKLLNFNSNLQQVNSSLMLILACQKQVSPFIYNHFGQILYDLFEY